MGVPEPLLWVFAGFAWAFLWVGFPGSSRPAETRDGVVRGCLTEDGAPGRAMEWVVLGGEIDGVSRGTVRIGIPRSRLAEGLRKGDCLSLTAKLEPYPGDRNADHMFGAAFLPIDFEGVLRPWDSLSVSVSRSDRNALSETFSRESRALSERFGHLFSPDVAGTLSAMVLSDTSRLSPELNQTFRTSGVFHLLSVSGEHMALLGAFVTGAFFVLVGIFPYTILRQAYVRYPAGGIAGCLVLAVMALYLGLIGAPLPAQRAFLGLAFLYAVRAFRLAWSWNDMLGLSVLVLLGADPRASLSLSFDLSLSALLGLVFFLDRSAPVLGDGIYEETRKEVVMARFREALEAGAFITATTSPLLWLCFRQFDWVGIVSNGIVVPLAGDVLLPAGFVYAGVLGVFPHGWPILTEALETLTRSVLGLVGFFSRLPHGQIPMPYLPPAAFLALCGAVGSFLAREPRSGRGMLLLSATVFMVLIAAVGGRPGSLAPSRALGPEAQGAGVFSYDIGTEAKNVKWLLGR